MTHDTQPTMQRPPASPLAVYIHWPFCKSKCPYCDFNSHVRERVDAAAWKTALMAEIRHMATLTPHHRVASVFFGGGTPSLMPPDIAQEAIDTVRACWPCEDGFEITLEANPTSVETGTFPAFRRAGVNRVSLGVQSFVPEALAFLGREHSADEARRAIALAHEHFERISFDLIYARPQQTLAQWEDELGEALAMAGTHLSLYQLTIEENTAFYTAYHKGGFIMPDEELAASLYETTARMTRAAGLIDYEVSNYAKPGHESRHNLAYWRGHDYVGIGPGAHGRITDNSSRYGSSNREHPASYRCATVTIKSPERWLASVQERGHGIESDTAMSARMVAEERLMMGLRIREGLPLADVAEFIDAGQHALLSTEGLLAPHPDRLIATEKGRLVLTALSASLLRAQDP